MKNLLIFSDLHLTQQDLPECNEVLHEILDIKKKVDIDCVADLGDTFDSLKPTSDCLDLISTFLKDLNCQSIILAANSHESETESSSIINHFGILASNVQVVKEYIDPKKLFLGHFFIKQSKVNYGSTRDILEFDTFKHVICGHQHIFEIIKPNFCHIGSCRYIDFAEASGGAKKILYIKDYGTDKEQCKFINLKSPYPMYDLEINCSLVEFSKKLNALSSNSKIRVICNTYEQYKDYLVLEQEFKPKFNIFKHKNTFDNMYNNLVLAKQQDISFEQGFKEWKDKQPIDKEVKEIIDEEMK